MAIPIGDAGDAVRLPGVYADLRAAHQRAHAEGDPRGPASSGSRRITEARALDAIDAGMPQVAVRWDVRKYPGAQEISWLAALRGPRDVLVHADDRIELIENSATVTAGGRLLRNPIG
jgi:hypothetical protein